MRPEDLLVLTNVMAAVNTQVSPKTKNNGCPDRHREEPKTKKRNKTAKISRRKNRRTK